MEKDKEVIRKSIDDLLAEDKTENKSNLPTFSIIEPMDYASVKSKSTIKAKRLMNSLLKFYLTGDIIEKSEYIQAKARIETMTMSGLFFQLQTAEHAITTLLRLIDSGEMSPRMFEVLGQLQKTMLDIMKQQTLQIMATEENMKKLKKDYDVYSDDFGKKEHKKTDTGISTRGTKNLMKQIQLEMGNVEEEEESFEDEE